VEDFVRFVLKMNDFFFAKDIKILLLCSCSLNGIVKLVSSVEVIGGFKTLWTLFTLSSV
jgi:hypothetical protein